MKRVTEYTTTTCPYCVMVKNFLREQGVPFEEVNVSKFAHLLDVVCLYDLLIVEQNPFGTVGELFPNEGHVVARE